MSAKITCPNCLTEHLPELEIKPNDKRTFRGKCKSCNSALKFKINPVNDEGFVERDFISFLLNGVQYTVNNEYPLSTTLNEYLRSVLNMTGTKVMCREGGCGSCLVNAEIFDHATQKSKFISLNTCLFPLYSCDGLKITTIEGIGSKSKGFNDIQKRIADYNGSQCGWCTTGMVMNMYSLLLKNPKPSKSEIENSMDGNICRCTGYRPILDAMKSFSIDEKPIDIEELTKLKCLNNNNEHKCQKSSKPIHLIQEEEQWFTPRDIKTLLSLLKEYYSSSYKLLSGNTGTGVFKNDGPFQIKIDIKQIEELYRVDKSPVLLKIGSQMTLNSLIDILTDYSINSGFEYLAEISHHLSKIANTGVRNVATWSGNLAMKHYHQDFPSDVFVCFETANARITLIDPEKSIDVTPLEMLGSMERKVIYSVSFKPYNKTNTFIKTYKIMPRSQNAHAYVNAGFKFDIDPSSKSVTTLPNMVFGGINETFVHAVNTEKYLVGKSLSDQNVLSNAFQILSKELLPSSDPVLSAADYRRSLAISLFYKFVLFVNQNNLNPRIKSAMESLIDSRELSSGQHSFPTDPSLYPVSKPMKKLNAYLQASGEAQYVYDKTPLRNQLEGAFILSSRGACRIDKIDDSLALNMPGVVKIIYAKDIPGKNTFVPTPLSPELLFAEDYIDYAGQAIGLVIGQSFEQVQNAAKAVKVTYKDFKVPILNVFDGIKAGSFFPKPVDDFMYGNASEAIKNSPNVIDGDCFLDTQFHFYMENQVAVCEQTEDGYEVYSSTQWIDLVQNAVTQVLGLSNSSCVNVKVKQVGGGYGGKITRANIPAAAAAVACSVMNKPVRVALDLNTSMSLIGKRFPWYAKYKIGFDETGKFLGILLNWYCDSGNSASDNAMAVGPSFVDNVYNCKNWLIVSNLVKTNLPANTAVRSPGFFPAIAIMESMIEHVAKYMKEDPLKIRQINLYKKGDITPVGQPLTYFNVDELIDQLQISSDYRNRLNQVNDFNRNNRWKKKGLSLTPIKWGISWDGGYYSCSIAIYASDGSVSLSHGGIEIGQGIHTKVSQVCAYKLGIPMETISIKYGDNFTNANNQTTGGSITSELASLATIECCKIIQKNLEPIRKLMPEKYTWPELISKAFSMGVDLSARYWLYPKSINPFQYCIYGAAVSEAIVDVLTGETQILRTDILYDGGQSINADIDLGQAEGAFIMGMGFWLQEKVRYDPKTGACLTNGTWEYKPPTTKDIPADFRITFLKGNPNPVGVLGSKAIGEPPLCLTPSVAFAVKRAIEAARSEIGKDEFFVLNSPATVESIQQLCMSNYDQYKLN